MLQANILGTSLNSGPFLAHNVPILTAPLPFYFYFLDMSTFTVLLAVSRHSVTSTGGVVLPWMSTRRLKCQMELSLSRSSVKAGSEPRMVW